MAKQEEKKKVKRPTAQKRDAQDKRRRLSNRIYKSRIKTAIRQYQETLGKEDESSTKDALSEVYSILDKCVKKGVLKLNKASRTKSRLSTRTAAKA